MQEYGSSDFFGFRIMSKRNCHPIERMEWSRAGCKFSLDI
jgi:hypothetical protein